jgi:hypothetical protein
VKLVVQPRQPWSERHAVVREPEAGVVGINPTSDASIRAADESGRPSRL